MILDTVKVLYTSNYFQINNLADSSSIQRDFCIQEKSPNSTFQDSNASHTSRLRLFYVYLENMEDIVYNLMNQHIA